MKSATRTDVPAEIARLAAEIAQIERSGPPVEMLQDTAVSELRKAERYYRDHGLPQPQGAVTQTQAVQAIIGFMMACSPENCIAAERKRVAAAFEARGGRGMTAEAKIERLAALHAQQRQLFAQRELAWRSAEASGQHVERVGADPEAFLRTTDDLHALAEGRDVA